MEKQIIHPKLAGIFTGFENIVYFIKFMLVCKSGIMKLPVLFLILFASGLFFPSCRKGKKDPILSLLPRDKRLVKTWVLSKAEGNLKHSVQMKTTTPSEIFTSSSDSSITFSYDNKIYYYVQVFRNISASYTSFEGSDTITYHDALLEIEFKTHGQITLNESGWYATGPGSSNGPDKISIQNSSTGIWNWATTNKDKDNINIDIPCSKFFRKGVYYVYKLSRGELILKKHAASEKSRTSNVFVNGSAGTGEVSEETGEDITYTFELKK